MWCGGVWTQVAVLGGDATGVGSAPLRPASLLVAPAPSLRGARCEDTYAIFPVQGGGGVAGSSPGREGIPAALFTRTPETLQSEKGEGAAILKLPGQIKSTSANTLTNPNA